METEKSSHLNFAGWDDFRVGTVWPMFQDGGAPIFFWILSSTGDTLECVNSKNNEVLVVKVFLD